MTMLHYFQELPLRAFPAAQQLPRLPHHHRGKEEHPNQEAHQRSLCPLPEMKIAERLRIAIHEPLREWVPVKRSERQHHAAVPEVQRGESASLVRK